MSLETRSPVGLRFGTFEVDLRAGELRKQGVRIKVQEQPFHVLTVPLSEAGRSRDSRRVCGPKSGPPTPSSISTTA